MFGLERPERLQTSSRFSCLHIYEHCAGISTRHEQFITDLVTLSFYSRRDRRLYVMMQLLGFVFSQLVPDSKAQEESRFISLPVALCKYIPNSPHARRYCTSTDSSLVSQWYTHSMVQNLWIFPIRDQACNRGLITTSKLRLSRSGTTSESIQTCNTPFTPQKCRQEPRVARCSITYLTPARLPKSNSHSRPLVVSCSQLPDLSHESAKHAMAKYIGADPGGPPPDRGSDLSPTIMRDAPTMPQELATEPDCLPMYRAKC